MSSVFTDQRESGLPRGVPVAISNARSSPPTGCCGSGSARSASMMARGWWPFTTTCPTARAISASSRLHPHLIPEEVDRFTHVDYQDRLALVAELERPLVGVARYDRRPCERDRRSRVRRGGRLSAPWHRLSALGRAGDRGTGPRHRHVRRRHAARESPHARRVLPLGIRRHEPVRVWDGVAAVSSGGDTMLGTGPRRAQGIAHWHVAPSGSDDDDRDSNVVIVCRVTDGAAGSTFSVSGDVVPGGEPADSYQPASRIDEVTRRSIFGPSNPGERDRPSSGFSLGESAVPSASRSAVPPPRRRSGRGTYRRRASSPGGRGSESCRPPSPSRNGPARLGSRNPAAVTTDHAMVAIKAERTQWLTLDGVFGVAPTARTPPISANLLVVGSRGAGQQSGSSSGQHQS